MKDWFVFVLALFLILTVWRSLETIEILSRYYKSAYSRDSDHKSFHKALNKKGLVREITLQTAWLIRDVAIMPIFLITLLL